MSRKTVALFVLTCCCLLTAKVALAEEKSEKAAPNNGCAYLNINLIIPGGGTAAVSSSGVACDHGYLSTIQPSQESTTLVQLQQSATYGPDCAVTIKWAGGAKTATIRTQQNYCGFQAGNVSASVVSGPVTITKTESGSFAGSDPGQVWVQLN